ncbi:DUF3016 domain-containing protein [Dyella sp.]|jgi:hypothetical protein|uniref:DUF3016 domain-containing protein n=1 Tax=Dyella sp. TaxID=1869338 RepID=UPI002D79BAD4|nr:DUF3016 domain-containing protein [Dyella sp.]HET6431995.1 DUF3016 domain-containing protein [Dyella sp.]
MARTFLSVLLLTALASTPALDASASTQAAPADVPVSVRYDHPERFAETREVRAFAPARASEDYLGSLKSYIEQRAGKLLAPGEQLKIVITDVDRAGAFEPWRGPSLSDVRIVKDIYPPRIDLHFQLTDASGTVLREGNRRLRDPGFLNSTTQATSTSNLRYEKALIDRWLRKGATEL